MGNAMPGIEGGFSLSVSEGHHENAPQHTLSTYGNLIQRVQNSRHDVVVDMRTKATLEMKKAEQERLGMHARVQESVQLRTALMHRKYEDIVKEVVAPERYRALRETEEVTQKTLCPDTLPLEGSLANTELTEADRSGLSRVVETICMRETDEAAGKLALSELDASVEVHEFAEEASNWATERQDAAQRRQILFNSRMRLPVKHAVAHLDATKLPAEKVEPAEYIPPICSTVVESEVNQSLISPRRGAGPTRYAERQWQTEHGVQPVVRNCVIATVLVDIGKTVPIRLRVYGGDDPEQTAKDFCLTYKKGAKARKMLVEAINKSITLTEMGEEEGDWVYVEDVHEVSIDLRRV